MNGSIYVHFEVDDHVVTIHVGVAGVHYEAVVASIESFGSSVSNSHHVEFNVAFSVGDEVLLHGFAFSHTRQVKGHGEFREEEVLIRVAKGVIVGHLLAFDGPNSNSLSHVSSLNAIESGDVRRTLDADGHLSE